VVDETSGRGSRESVEQARRAGFEVIVLRGASAAGARNAGLEAVRRRGVLPAGWVFLEAGSSLEPGCLAAWEATLRLCPDAGLVTSWVWDDARKTRPLPCPAFPYQWLANEVPTGSAIRAEAVGDVGGFREGLGAGFEDWDMANAVMAAGWKAVTYPASLLDLRSREPGRLHAGTPAWRELAGRFPELVARDALELLALLAESRASWRARPETLTPLGFLRRPLREQLGLLAQAARDPRRAARWLAWQTGWGRR
jgi:hypothetical protein